jgi:hypothetical protein
MRKAEKMKNSGPMRRAPRMTNVAAAVPPRMPD